MRTHICPGCREPIPTQSGRLVVHDSDPEGASGEFHSVACWLKAQNADEEEGVKSVESLAKNLICDAECVLADEGKLTG